MFAVYYHPHVDIQTTMVMLNEDGLKKCLLSLGTFCGKSFHGVKGRANRAGNEVFGNRGGNWEYLAQSSKTQQCMNSPQMDTRNMVGSCRKDACSSEQEMPISEFGARSIVKMGEVLSASHWDYSKLVEAFMDERSLGAEN